MGTLKLWSGQDALTELPRKGKCQDDTFWEGLFKDELQGRLINGFQSWMTIKTGRLETIPGTLKPRKRLAWKAVSKMDTQEIFSGNKEIAAPGKAI
ncbi:hypothetical protein [Shewanella carassii]|uniref:Uncharacterized protein n=1 Tax=Shewanella carassii TaxID=1987584 RepID=A0ABQ1T7J9_9GAMM|nr:hypothetical protein [Shewanella carassii]GGE86003.1 hypothetical protein GCM10011520_28030 [Shewanella carassii]